MSDGNDKVGVQALTPVDLAVFTYHLGSAESGHALEAVVEQGVGGSGGY